MAALTVQVLFSIRVELELMRWPLSKVAEPLT